jgi:filamentous hemagglutinin family protein
MNHIYRSIWNEALGVWLAVSELAKGRGKSVATRRKLLLTGGLVLCSSSAWALPVGEQLVAGQASVSIPSADRMQINQASQNAIINWQGFSVGQNQAVNVLQPNSQAALLNRVVGQDASQIQGHINANGQVYLVNPNGVLFSNTAQVDVGGLIASTHNISNADFMNGNKHFTQNGATGNVENHGTINTLEGGVVALIGEQVTNTGTINTPKGTTALAAGKTVDLDFQGNGLVEVKVSEAALNAQIHNKGALQADGGRVVMTAKAAGQLIDTVINQEGTVQAQSLLERNGEIILAAGYVAQTGSLNVSGATGGKIDIKARAILDAGTSNADGTVGKAGDITMLAHDAVIQTASANAHANGATTGGKVHIQAGNRVYSSGSLSATGTQGGSINVVSEDSVVLAAAQLNASGDQQGGVIHVGGEAHGANKTLPNAKTTYINGATTLKADGGKGQVVVWSDDTTDAYGTISANSVGNIEVSSRGTLTYGATADAGQGGSLLLDPKNIIISATGGMASYGLIDPHPVASSLFGQANVLLGNTVNGVFTENGNIAVSSANDSFAASNAGAVYLFNSTTGALLATLTGSNANDYVGLYGITALSNGNYVVRSPNWSDYKGAATWGNGLTGISGMVSSANSLVGSTAYDNVSGNGVTALSNGNYVVSSPRWKNTQVPNTSALPYDPWLGTNAGAVTWGNGSTGSNGIVSSANSLVGAATFDQVGFFGVTALTNGNYVVGSPYWDDGNTPDVGAATWGNGLTGTSGFINSTNSLVGTFANERMGGSVALSNGNYVVLSHGWNSGAVTWGDGSTGISGKVNANNSLIGISAVTPLSNGNYVASNPYWYNGAIPEVGIVTWGNGSTGTSGIANAFNSLIGSSAYDHIGSDGNIIALTNGNYVIASPLWDNGSIINAGAVTWANGSTAIRGTISPANSLVGTTTNDFNKVSIIALNNGNYVIGNPTWDNGTIVDAGAATWGNGLTGISGVINSTNSLVGSQSSDAVSSIENNYYASYYAYNVSFPITSLQNGIVALNNGNYVVTSSRWSNGNKSRAGAVTWANGNTGISGVINSTNSLVGTTAFDNVGYNGVTALSNGNYVISSPYWHNGSIADAGAVTWGNGQTGSVGDISANNSLVGTNASDYVGSLYTFYPGRPGRGPASPPQYPYSTISNTIFALSNGNYIVGSNNWANNSGATTWGNGQSGTIGTIDSNNSFLNANVYSVIGGSIGSILSNGNYLQGNLRIATPQNIYFNNGIGQTMNFAPLVLTNTLATGTNITLQASNDITLNTDVIVQGNNGGTLTLQAGRNINLNASIRTANGDFTAIAGDPNALTSDREAGIPTITLGSGATINAGTGKVILAAINGNFINLSGSINPISAKQWLIYSTDPSQNILGGMTADNIGFNQAFTTNTPSYANTGTWFLYSNVAPPIITAPLITPPATTLPEPITTPQQNNAPVAQLALISPDTNKLVQSNKPTNFESWLSQLTPLQRSTSFEENNKQLIPQDNNPLLDIENGGIKLPVLP